MKRQYDTQLLWAYITKFADAYPDRPPGGRVQVLFYLRGKAGAYYLNNGPRLYWDETLGDGYFVKTDPGGLELEADLIREVVVLGLKKGKEPVLFPGYSEFLSAIGFEN